MNLDEDFAEKLEEGILGAMSIFRDNPNGADYYECSFCVRRNSKHDDDCLGEKFLALRAEARDALEEIYEPINLDSLKDVS